MAVAPALRRLGNASARGEPLRRPVGREGPNRGLYHAIRGGKRLYRDLRCLVGPLIPGTVVRPLKRLVDERGYLMDEPKDAAELGVPKGEHPRLREAVQ